MNLTLHLTDNCNMRCKYCYVNQSNKSMTREVAFAAVDFAITDSASCGLAFFGGEPLLERELIYDIITYTQKIKRDIGKVFYYKMTTNGTLLDESFLKYSSDVKMMIGFSHDGITHDNFRTYHNGGGTADLLSSKIPMLLHYQPYTIAMCTVNPENAKDLAQSIEWIFNKGFRYIVISPNYDRSANWDRKSLAALESSYKKIAALYIKWTRENHKFYLSSFEMKISSHLQGDKYCEDRCQLGKKQLSVAPNGKLYPCVQFVDEQEYEMGDVFSGIDIEKRKVIEERGAATPIVCEDCVVKRRCNHTCGCLNRQATGSIDIISPIQCAHERMLLPLADSIATKLYKERNMLFIHKQYNEFYPILSLIDDNS